jgi:Spy/CpxP family protein refolding chaperone
MKKVYFACLCLAVSILFLFPAAPLRAQEAGVEEDEMIITAAGPESESPMAAQGPVQGQPAGPGRQAVAGQQARPGWREGFHRWKGAGFEGFLGLTEDQKARTKDLWRRYFAETHNLRYDVMQKRLEMERLFTDPKADQAALLAVQKQLGALRQQLMDRRAQAIIEWRSLLTPEQIQKLDLLSMVHRRTGWRMGRGMMPGMTGAEK